MPNKEYYVQQSENDGLGMFSIFKVLGNTKTMSSGWTTFTLKAAAVSFGCASVAGLGATMVLAPLLGPVLPFMVGSSLGWVGGMMHRWYWDSKEALHALREFPEVMGHHIMLLGPSQFSGIDIKAWREGAAGSVFKRSLAIVALYGASDAIRRIQEEREEQLVRMCMEEGQSSSA